MDRVKIVLRLCIKSWVVTEPKKFKQKQSHADNLTSSEDKSTEVLHKEWIEKCNTGKHDKPNQIFLGMAGPAEPSMELL